MRWPFAHGHGSDRPYVAIHGGKCISPDSHSSLHCRSDTDATRHPALRSVTEQLLKIYLFLFSSYLRSSETIDTKRMAEHTVSENSTRSI